MPEGKYQDLNIEERRSRILEILTQQGKVKVNELSKLFGISEVTIRNDLSELEMSGLLERTHGGAISTYKAYYNMSIADRMRTNEEEKRKIASAVASMISDMDTIMINSGTTTLFVVQELKSVKNLTIVTNSIPISLETGNYKDFHTILLGGNFNTRDQFTYGDDAINQLKKYKANKLVLSVDGINSEDGISTYHHLEAEINRQMLARVNKTIVVADYTKIGRTSFAHIVPIENVDMIVTNKKANSDEINLIREKGVEVILV
ncbi:MAG TPA: DeoR/GlpR transcriptional regulator [Clostridiaceae bacterium]|nr:DeoR/GlpR transcriptional regulator [Clostridiaceae bacterium]